MKISSALLSALILTSSFAEAETQNETVSSCKQYSMNLIRSMKQEIFPDMTQDEIVAALKLADKNCRSLVKTVKTETREQQKAEIEAEQKESGGDWFTKYVLEGDPHDKPGVKRLKKRK